MEHMSRIKDRKKCERVSGILCMMVVSTVFLFGCGQQQAGNGSQAGAFDATGQGPSTNLGRAPLTSDSERRTGPLVGDAYDALGKDHARSRDTQDSATKGRIQQDLRVSQTTANAVRAIPGIAHAYVVYAGHTAFVAVSPDPTHKRTTARSLSQSLQSQIQYTVTHQNRNFSTVLITSDPQAFMQFQGYASNVPDGAPVVSGNFSQLYAVIHRVWPNHT